MKPNTWSDFKCLMMLNTQPKNSLEEIHIYKSCAALAVSGLTHPEENHLNDQAKNFLEVRRLMHKNDLIAAEALLNRIVFKQSFDLNSNDFIYLGDQSFLLGMIANRKGDCLLAAQKMKEAAQYFEKGNDLHRRLRALINEKLALANELDGYTMGELYGLQMYANQEKMYDLAGNIARSRACEMLSQGNFSETIVEAKQAIDYYQLDGYPDDLAITYCLLSIAYFLTGRMEESKEISYKIIIKEGKVASYWKILETLSSGKIPSLHSSHPLAKTPWKKAKNKKESITGKIIEALKVGPRTRDELIFSIWGDQAYDQSYCSRLYSALNQIRKDKGLTILFNGDKYEIFA